MAADDEQRFVELLRTSFRAVSGMPLDPHIKNRSRAQGDVVTVCVETDRIELATELLGDIKNWRKGIALADAACWMIEHGRTGEVGPLIGRALAVADEVMLEDNPQEWRRDRVRARVARAKFLLGQEAEAAELARTVLPAELGPVIDVQMRRLDPKDFDAQLAAIDEHIAVGDFEQTKAALTSGLALYERFFADEKKRSALETRLRASHREVPSGIQAGFLTGMAEAALTHGDAEKARTLLAAVMVFLESAPQWHPEERVAFEARIAGLHARAGVPDEARAQIGRIEKFYSESRERIESTYRAAPLRAIAEAWVTIGDRAEAARVYRMAVEAGAENPNARPRSVDLAETCCSMVRSRFLPDAILSARIDAIQAGLTDPW
ncbi:MAG: hypothetical protein AB7N24_23530 [Dehalococcoidia bacterium]